METTSKIMATPHDEACNEYDNSQPIKIETMIDNPYIQAKDYPTLITKINGVPLKMDNNSETHAVTDNSDFHIFENINNGPLDLTKNNIKAEYVGREVVPVQSYQYSSLNDPISLMNQFCVDPLPTLSETERRLMMMAKTAFSKRTRTLYHWMHPHATKNQISLAIENAWNSLSYEEKHVYIAQATGRSLYGHSGPMINPHLDKVLPMAMALTNTLPHNNLDGSFTVGRNENPARRPRPYNFAEMSGPMRSVIQKNKIENRNSFKSNNNNKRHCSSIELKNALSSITNVQESDSTTTKLKSRKTNIKSKTNRINFKIEDFENDSELLKELVQYESLYRKKK